MLDGKKKMLKMLTLSKLILRFPTIFIVPLGFPVF